MPQKKTSGHEDSIEEELRHIKLLLIATLLHSGVKQGDIAALLGVSDATMSRMLPKGARFRAKGSD